MHESDILNIAHMALTSYLWGSGDSDALGFRQPARVQNFHVVRRPARGTSSTFPKFPCLTIQAGLQMIVVGISSVGGRYCWTNRCPRRSATKPQADAGALSR